MISDFCINSVVDEVEVEGRSRGEDGIAFVLRMSALASSKSGHMPLARQSLRH
jgi:hypothetical protein